ncbi:MAG: hypothetical protein ABI197_12900 [Granulicella sp.]
MTFQSRPATSRFLRTAALCGAAALFAVGCNKKTDNTSNYTNAIDTYYSAHPACLWSDPIKFPVQADTADVSKTTPYDALVDQGLLVRTTAEKKKLIISSKQVNNYDLSDQGRSAWTADPTQPGFGNFCYGHRKVSSIDSSTPTNDQTGATTTINYHYTFDGAPNWASAAETQNAYPEIHANLNGPHTDQVTLTNTNAGWQMVRPILKPSPVPVTGADGKIVQ